MILSEQTLSDSSLLQRMAEGDTLSFDQLFYRHYQRVYGLLFRLVGNRAEAEDLTQEVFLTLYQNPPQRQGEQNVAAWLYRVATNTAYNHIRSRKRRWQRNTWLVPGADPASDNVPNDPARTVEQRETVDRVRRALWQLPERQAQLLLLRQMGLSYAELADACGVAPGSVGTLLSRAAKAFQKQYAAEAESPGEPHDRPVLEGDST